MRLFVAFDVPERVRDTLDAVVAPLRKRHDGLRWAPAFQWHVTLAFIGHVPVGDRDRGAIVGDIQDVLREPAAAGPDEIRFRLAPPGRFGSRVLWTGVDDAPHGAVADLGASLKAALAEADLPVDDKPVHPHLTLARSRRRGGSRITAGLVDEVPDVAGEWTVDECVLFESARQSSGPNRYEVRARVPLG